MYLFCLSYCSIFRNYGNMLSEKSYFRITRIFKCVHIYDWKKLESECLTWGCQPNSSGQRKVASLIACLSMANFSAPLFTPRWSWNIQNLIENKSESKGMGKREVWNWPKQLNHLRYFLLRFLTQRVCKGWEEHHHQLFQEQDNFPSVHQVAILSFRHISLDYWQWIQWDSRKLLEISWILSHE